MQMQKNTPAYVDVLCHQLCEYHYIDNDIILEHNDINIKAT